jgi:serine protease Do
MADRPAHLELPRRWVILSLLVVLGGPVVSGPSLCGSEARRTPLVRAVQEARASVVNIRGEKMLGAVPDSRVEGAHRVNGMGTGVVIDPRGYVITNHHVVDGVREIQITLADESRHIARLIRRDPETDLAIIKFEPSQPLPVIKMGTSSDLMLGESVIAIGNAYGYPHTVTRGIVSAVHRSVRVSDAQHYDDLIQTDASINPGNSGGPLLNIDGEMIGINVAVRAGAQGIGFAIPMDKVMSVVTELMAAQAAEKNWHGLRVKDLEVNQAHAVVVAAVEEKSPAESAGLKAGDIIAQVGSAKAERPLDFYRALLDLSAGEQVAVSVRRGEEKLSLALTLGKPAAGVAPSNRLIWDTLGLDLKPLALQDFEQQYRSPYRGGLFVSAVRPQSPAAEQGLRRGDVLVGLHVWETVAIEHVNYVLGRSDFASFNPVRFIILRGKDSFYGFLPVAGVPTKRD